MPGIASVSVPGEELPSCSTHLCASKKALSLYTCGFHINRRRNEVGAITVEKWQDHVSPLQKIIILPERIKVILFIGQATLKSHFNLTLTIGIFYPICVSFFSYRVRTRDEQLALSYSEGLASTCTKSLSGYRKTKYRRQNKNFKILLCECNYQSLF